MTKKAILDDFPKHTKKEWRELIDKQLKGASFEKKLITKTPEQILLQPIYHQQDGKTFSESLSSPGSFPFTRGANPAGNRVQPSKISQEFLYPTPQDVNQAIRHDSQKGLQEIRLILDEAGKQGLDPESAKTGLVGLDGTSIATKKDFEYLFKGVDLSELSFQFQPGQSSSACLSLFISYLKSTSFELKDLMGSIVFDPIGVLVAGGESNYSIDYALDEMAGLVNWSRDNTPQFRVIGIDSRVYSESGASAVQELAYAFGTAVTYIRGLLDRGMNIDDVASSITFTFSAGADFFMEVGKFRAARSIWAQIIEAFGGLSDSRKLSFSVVTSNWNKTTHDPHVNMLRSTTEALSAMMGGCDSLSVSPFDMITGLPDKFSRRIARNSQEVIQKESHVDKVIDPAGGSWFIENLTEELASNAWETFQNIEKKGGILEAIKAGDIQSDVKGLSTSRKKAVAQRERVIVGTNMFANLEEEIPVGRSLDLNQIKEARSLEISRQKSERSSQVGNLLQHVKQTRSDEKIELSIQAAEAGATLGELVTVIQKEDGESLKVEPLIAERLSDEYEELRKKALAFKKRQGQSPQVFLANMGDLLQHKSRTDFVIDFLKPGGFEVVSPEGFDSAASASRAILESGLKIVVICSTDKTYPELVPEITRHVREVDAEILITLAGYPREQVDSFKAMGVDHFIHIKANNLELLKKFQAKVGVNR
ncbi:MAG: methylmalonyl-CoA mutase [Proteobacteria bacterium]|nr:methylmalonyl-CoA mutase [Pseudomonadota bacterium]